MDAGQTALRCAATTCLDRDSDEITIILIMLKL
jgi:hypothetical protein